MSGSASFDPPKAARLFDETYPPQGTEASSGTPSDGEVDEDEIERLADLVVRTLREFGITE